MERFLVASSTAREWQAAVDECLERWGKQAFTQKLGFIYTTDAHSENLGAIVSRLQAKSGVPHWVGTTGLGILCADQEHYDVPAISIMICRFPEDAFRVFSAIHGGFEEFDKANHLWLENNFGNFAIVHADPTNPKLQQLIPAFSEKLNGGFLVGGLTSSQSGNVQIADRATSGGLSGVVFSDKVPVVTGLSQGCSPLGPAHTITQAQRNIVITIDNRPAVDVFTEDIGELLAKDLSRVAGYVFVGFPVVGSDTGDYVVRNLVGIDPQNKVLAVGELLSTGDPIMFCRRDSETAREDLVRMVRDVKQRTAGAEPKGAVYYSCLGRGRYTFGENSEEIRTIQHELGDVPLVGFFANGEVSHNRLYGYTGVLTLFV
ncbi:MAG: FIST C-terminal domain-containing protein [Gammaproteobacteria bacterium]|nr:FIST C-terminal domain-containing protein [Gammaproteobacteria bacterium]